MNYTIEKMTEYISQSELNSREKVALIHRLNKLTLEELAKNLGVGKERARQIEAKAVRKVRWYFSKERYEPKISRTLTDGLVDDYFPIRVANSLRMAGIYRLSGLLDLDRGIPSEVNQKLKTINDLKKCRNIGDKVLSMVKEVIRKTKP